MQTKLMSLNINTVIENYLSQNPISQGIIGIQLPGMVSTDIINGVVNDLFYNNSTQVVIIPPPLTTVFDSGVDKDIKAIAGRVQRDKLDGIRYNRVYIALYWDDLGSLNSHHHDIFFNFEERGKLGGYQVSISDNREFGGDVLTLVKPRAGDKLVISNQMKTVLSQLDTNKVSGQPVEMLFSLKSLSLRGPADDWWIEFPEFTDEKSMASNILKYLQDNKQIFTDVIWVIKDRITNDIFGVGVILEFPKYNNIMATMIDGPSGRFVRIKVGMNYFFFSVERAIMFDWYKLMVDQLDVLAGVQ